MSGKETGSLVPFMDPGKRMVSRARIVAVDRKQSTNARPTHLEGLCPSHYPEISDTLSYL